MKRTILFLLIIFVAFGCKKDDDNINDENQIEFTEDGLQVGVPPIVNDTIVRNENMTIEIVNGNNDEIVISNIYKLNLEGGSFSRVQKGTTIIDNKDGRLWLVTEVIENTGGQIKVKALPGLLGNLFQNAIIKASLNENRAKLNSEYVNKLPSNQVTLTAFDQDFLWEVNQEDINNTTIQISEGASLSIDEDRNIIVAFDDFKLFDSNGSSLKITQGTATIKGAVDAEMKFNPIQTILGFGNPLTIQAGSIKDFKSAVYLSADFDVTFGGEFDFIEFTDTLPLTNHIIVVPVGCCAFIELELDVFLRATINLSSEFSLTPNFKDKNDFVGISNYMGLGSIPTFDYEFENIESTATVSDTYNVDAGIKLEFVPKASMYLYGLIGPSGELAPFIELNAETQIDGSSNTITWDAEIDYGINSQLTLDVNVLGNNSWIENENIGIQPIITFPENNILEKNLYDVPNGADITLGNNQSGIINSELQNPIEIQVKDSFGNGIQGVTVFFQTESGNGTFEEDFVITDADGSVFNNWTLGSIVGEQTANAFAKDGNGVILSSTEVDIIAIGTTTGTTQPANSPIPADNSTEIALEGSLSFTEGENTPSDATFRILFDQNPNPTFVYNLGIGETSLTYSNLEPISTFYWQVQTLDGNNNVLAESPIWSFTTEEEPMTVTDIDGNVYQTIQIGNQVWIAENLKVTRFRNGDEIPTGLTGEELRLTTDPAYTTLDVNLYGHHYNWYTFVDSRGICPNGFRVPTTQDINELNSFLQGDGGKLKSTSNLWEPPNTGASNETGFTAEPAGQYRFFPNDFHDQGTNAIFWTSQEDSNAGATHFGLSNVNSNVSIIQNQIKEALRSCRCIEE